jgi:hypothetical protein
LGHRSIGHGKEGILERLQISIGGTGVPLTRAQKVFGNDTEKFWGYWSIGQGIQKVF